MGRRFFFGADVHFGTLNKNPFTIIEKTMGGGIGFVNLEGPVVENSEGYALKGEKIYLANDPKPIRFLKKAAIRFVSIQNNHRFDQGKSGSCFIEVPF